MLNILLTSKNIDLTAAFYKALGETVTSEKHSVGPAHFSLGESTPEIYPERKDHPDETLVIRIETKDRLEDVLDRVAYVYDSGHNGSIIDGKNQRKILLLDPDGRSVEIVQMKGPHP
ncbi:MAG TPA: hypothetical protein VIN59_07710 [Alphaproteobacteria bacterium]